MIIKNNNLSYGFKFDGELMQYTTVQQIVLF